MAIANSQENINIPVTDNDEQDIQEVITGTEADNGEIDSVESVTKVESEDSYIGPEPEALEEDTAVEPKVMITENEDKVKEMKASELADKPEKEVDIGYGTVKKSNLTGAVAVIDAEEINKDAAFSLEKILQGKTSGVHVTQNSGAPGEKVTVSIRGAGSIHKGKPLYVVDGLSTSQIDHINPNDIESISILKDASSAAIYCGPHSLNGVVLINTKKGKTGESVINYNAYMGIQRPWNKPDMCTAEEWAMFNNEAYRNANLPAQEELEDPASLGDGTYWFDEILNENATVQNHNVSLMRGTENLKYYLGYGFFKQEGIIKGSEYKRHNVRMNAESDAKKWLSFGNNLTFNHFDKINTNESNEWSNVIVTSMAIDPVTPVDSAGQLMEAQYNNIENPVGIIEHTNDLDKENRLSGNIFAQINFFNIIKYRSSFGLDLSHNDTYKFIPKYNLAGGSSEIRSSSTVTRYNSKSFGWVWENKISFDKTLAGKHNFKFINGIILDKGGWENLGGENSGTASNDSSQWYLDACTDTEPWISGNAGRNSFLSILGRLNYNFKDKYLLAFSLRKDNTPIFGPNNKWGTFPSIAGAWRVSEEKFMELAAPVLTNLKIRCGWGKLGNQEIVDYLFTTTTTSGQQYVFNGELIDGTTFLSAGNEEILFEEQTSFNIGGDLGMVDGKIEFIMDYFNKKTTFIILEPTITSIFEPQTALKLISGELENKGFEFELGYKEKIGDFTANLSANLSTYTNEVISLGSDKPITDVEFRNSGSITRTEEGHPIALFYGYVTDGLFQTQADVDAHTYINENGDTLLVQPDAAPGDIRYKDEDGDGEWDRDYIGNPHPDFIFGFSMDIAYKGIDLSLFLQGSVGNDIYNGLRYYTDNNTGYFNLDKRMKNRWVGEGSTNDVKYPRMNASDANNIRISDRYVEDGSYLRIKTLQMGYSLPEAFLEKIYVSKLRIYIGVQNLYTFTKYLGLDPEIGMGDYPGTENDFLDIGIDRGTYPQARAFIGGINLSF